ncbi:MAG: hypothetical protein C4297_07715 [Gemmataceae bacterium]|mgnify:CR=1 FL=1
MAIRSSPRRLLCWVALFLGTGLASLPGCRTGQELLEAELRSRERELEELKNQLARCDCDLQALETELEALRRKTLKPGEPAYAPWFVKHITLGRLTGGYDQDPECPGDEALQVLIEPRDADDHSVKAPGDVRIEVSEITPEGLKRPLSVWELTAKDLRRKWEQPLFGDPAYRLILPWKVQPTMEKLRVVVQFQTADGRRFEVDRDVSVRLPKPPARRPTLRGPHLPEAPQTHAPPESSKPAEQAPPPRKNTGPERNPEWPQLPEPPTPPEPEPVQPLVYYIPHVPPADAADPASAPTSTRPAGLRPPAGARPAPSAPAGP